jgi:hypothetical protein
MQIKRMFRNHYRASHGGINLLDLRTPRRPYMPNPNIVPNADDPNSHCQLCSSILYIDRYSYHDYLQRVHVIANNPIQSKYYEIVKTQIFTVVLAIHLIQPKKAIVIISSSFTTILAK